MDRWLFYIFILSVPRRVGAKVSTDTHGSIGLITEDVAGPTLLYFW